MENNMKYYINTNKELFGIEQGQEFLVESDWVECITQEEGIPFSKYNTDGTPDLEAIQAEQEANELEARMSMMLTPRQARLILLQYGLLDDIEAMLSTDRAMQIWWEYSLDIKRGNEHIVNAGIALNLTEEELDIMFIEGSKL